jgi:hypothetical protein
MGRVVITHSTYIEGLIPLLKVLAQDPSIGTVTPAVICRVRGRASQLRLRVSTPIVGGHEVFVLTTLSRADLQQKLDQLLDQGSNQ